jgi:transmembrane sensor
MNSRHKNFTIEDFAQDSYFQKWVKDPSEESEEFWANWLSKNSERIFDINEAADLVKSLRFKENDITEEHVDKLWMNLSKGIKKDTKTIQFQERKNSYEPFLKVAAVLIPLLIVGYLLVEKNEFPANTEIALTSTVKKVNSNGKKTQFTLPDGTRVFLNANSKLIYSSQFEDEIIRKVKLKGEAFFQVKRDTLRPFIVESGDLQTQVLGTSFNVNAFSESEISVAVEEGRVQLRNMTKSDGDASIMLSAHDLGVFQKDTNLEQLVKSKITGNELFDWRNGVIHFKKADFNEIRNKLERWYGVTFEIERTIDSKKDFTGSYANKPLSTVLDGLQFVYDFEYKIDKKKITIN